jgi:hypothetical protein
LIQSHPSIVANPKETKTLPEWKALFSQIKNEDNKLSPGELECSVAYMHSSQAVPNMIKTPARMLKFEKLPVGNKVKFEKLDSESIDISPTERIEWSDILPPTLFTFMDKLGDNVNQLVDEVTNIRTQIPVFSEVSKDLLKLAYAVEGIKQTIGTDISGNYPDIWSAIGDLDEGLNNANTKTLKQSVAKSTFDIAIDIQL